MGSVRNGSAWRLLVANLYGKHSAGKLIVMSVKSTASIDSALINNIAVTVSHLRNMSMLCTVPCSTFVSPPSQSISLRQSILLTTPIQRQFYLRKLV
jgi:hypothetical protein